MINCFNRYALGLALCLLSLWLGASLAVDIVAVPAVFRTLKDVSEAGKVGMVVFSRFNKLEVALILASLLLQLSQWRSLMLRGRVERALLFSSNIVLLFIAILFCFFWTPAIIEYSRQMFELSSDNPAYQLALEKHRFYHKAYVKVEGVKLLVLLGLIALLLKQSFCQHKEVKS